MAKTVYLLDRTGTTVAYTGIEKILVPIDTSGNLGEFYSEEFLYKPEEVNALPTPSSANLGKIIVYNDVYYVCELSGTTYNWVTLVSIDEANAGASDILLGKTAYNKEGKIVGTIPYYAGEYE